jgi:hypothetical protein
MHAASSAFCWLSATPGLRNTVGWPLLHPASVLTSTGTPKNPIVGLPIR